MDQSSLERPEPETKRMVRCLAKKAKYSNRLDVVEHLREVTPAGTTGRRRQILMVIFWFLFDVIHAVLANNHSSLQLTR